MTRVLLTTVFRPFGVENKYNKKGDETLLDYLASRLTREPGLFTLSSYVPHSSLHLIAANLPAETRGIGVSQHGGVRRGAQEGLELRRHLVRHQRLRQSGEVDLAGAETHAAGEGGSRRVRNGVAQCRIAGRRRRVQGRRRRLHAPSARRTAGAADPAPARDGGRHAQARWRSTIRTRPSTAPDDDVAVHGHGSAHTPWCSVTRPARTCSAAALQRRTPCPHVQRGRAATPHARPHVQRGRAATPHALSARAARPRCNAARPVRTYSAAVLQRRTPCPHVQRGRAATPHALSARTARPCCNAARPVHTYSAARERSMVAALSGSLRCEGIQRLDRKDGEVTRVPRDDDQMVDDRRGSDQRILDQVITAPVEELCPSPKDAGINRKNVPSLRDEINPGLDLGGLARVLFTRDLHACLQLAKSDGREMQILVRGSIYPSHNRPVRSWFAQFGNDVRVEKVHGAQSNAGGSRRRRARRAGTGMSARGNSASSKSLRRGRVASSKLRHWSTRTSTAISTPRRVTICGPLVRLASSNSLKRAFASCTGQILRSFFLATFVDLVS